MIFDPKAVLRLLNYVAVLKARRDKLVLVWETYDEMRDQNKTTIPDHSSRPSVFKSVFFGGTTVETGDIHETLRNAKALTSNWMREFVDESSKGCQQGWLYLVKKRDEGHEHLQAMARVYSKAARANIHERQDADLVARSVKTVKLSCDVLVNVIGSLPGVGKAGPAVEATYEVLSSEEIWNHVWGVGNDPDVVGVLKHKGQELAKIGAKAVGERAEHLIEHAMEKKVEQMIFQKLGMEGAEFVEHLGILQKLVDLKAKWVWRNWDKGRVAGQELGSLFRTTAELEKDEYLYSQAVRSAKASARPARTLGHAMKAARWLYVAHEVKEKLEKIREVWEEPIEGEETAAEGGETAATRE